MKRKNRKASRDSGDSKKSGAGNRSLLWMGLLQASLLLGPFAGSSAGRGHFYILLKEHGLWAQGSPNNAGSSRAISGPGNVAWGIGFAELRERLTNLATASGSEEKVEILNVLPNRYIDLKRNDVIYRYNFYKTPYSVARLREGSLSREEHEQQDSLLFHVRLRMLLMPTELIKKKIEDIYGASSSSIVDEKGYGVSRWEGAGGMIFLWHEPYNEQSFTGTIDYMSRELTEGIKSDYKDFFDAREKLLLQQLRLQ